MQVKQFSTLNLILIGRKIMKKANVILLISIFTILSFVVKAQKQPIISELKLVAKTPSEIRGISAIAYNEGKIWAISSHDKGRYAIFNLEDNKWELSDSGEHYKAIREIAGRYNDVGGMTFANEKLWLGSGYGYSFGSVDMKTYGISLAWDGDSLWIIADRGLRKLPLKNN